MVILSVAVWKNLWDIFTYLKAILSFLSHIARTIIRIRIRPELLRCICYAMQTNSSQIATLGQNFHEALQRGIHLKESRLGEK
jgi:hypothetical protein